MKYQVCRAKELSGVSICPCYEIVVRQIPNVLERFFGEHEYEFTCVSDYGINWYRLPKYVPIKIGSSLDRALYQVVQEKVRKAVELLFESIKQAKTKIVTEDMAKMN